MFEQPIHGYGLCECGCGAKTAIAKASWKAAGYVKGEPRRFINGHWSRKHPTWTVEDRGYLTPCWVWQGKLGNHGYGKVDVDERLLFAYNVVYEQERGPIPERLELDHLCRVASCVNPEHLEPVTHAENVRRGRAAKLDWDKVREIRRRAAAGEARRALAKEFGVSKITIHNIIHHKHWAER